MSLYSIILAAGEGKRMKSKLPKPLQIACGKTLIDRVIDAVSSAGFITPKKTEDLLKKLESLVSKNQAKELVSQVYIDSNTKCDNEEIYYVIDALHEAVLSKKKVKFVYKRRNIDVRNKKSYTEKTFVVSPYALI